MINIETIKEILRGIEQDEIGSPDGWWETSAGAQDWPKAYFTMIQK